MPVMYKLDAALFYAMSPLIPCTGSAASHFGLQTISRSDRTGGHWQGAEKLEDRVFWEHTYIPLSSFSQQELRGMLKKIDLCSAGPSRHCGALGSANGLHLPSYNGGPTADTVIHVPAPHAELSAPLCQCAPAFPAG